MEGSEMATKGRVVVDIERCKGCELCASVCPHSGIRMSEHFNSSGYRPAVWVGSDDACTGCATCAVICPDAAITVYRVTVAAVAAQRPVPATV